MAAHSVLLRVGMVALVAGAVIGSAPGVHAVAQSPRWSVPRTEWGDPDFQGIWTYATMTPLERPRELADKPTLSPAEAEAYEARTNTRQRETNNTAGPDWWDPGTRTLIDGRTSLVVEPVDGRLPALTPDARARAARAAELRRQRGDADGPEDMALNVRCLSWATAGPPMLPGVYNNNVQFVQTRTNVVLVSEMIHDARIVPMDGRPHGALPRWMGDSRGRWEGTTLVVDTVNFSGKTSVRGSDEHLHLTERLTRTSADSIDYRFTMDDPTVWTEPWTVSFPLRRTAEPMYEYACHEGNAMSMEGILRAARFVERDRRP